MADRNKLELSVYNAYDRIVEYDDGLQELERDPIFNWEVTRDDKFHTVQKFETLRGIAYKEYLSETKKGQRLWWVLADVNGIEDPTDLSNYIGEQILIPSLKELNLF